MAPNLKHKRSGARLISPPFPTASSTMVFETAREERWSGESVMSDGYSNLFASGFLRQHISKQPSISSFTTPDIVRGPFHPSPDKTSPDRLSPGRNSFDKLSPNRLSPHDALKTPARRRRSSIIHTTPMTASPRVYKSGGMDAGVERALDSVMKSLKLMAMGTPKISRSPPQDESRWSSSSEESLAATEESGFWGPRKSGESTRSRMTIGTMRSAKSSKSKKSRKSEDTDRMDIDGEDIPPVPFPATPSRRRRMVEGLVKRLGLTPKKKKSSPVPELPVEPITPRLPRKSSFSTLRSALTKKSSTGTLRSVRSTKSTHPFMGSGPTLDCEAYPPMPVWHDGEHGEGCLPTTPRRRTPKSSIGQPRLQPSTSPSTFLKEMPRRAPGTPKESAQEVPPVPSTESSVAPAGSPAMPHDTFTISLQEKLRHAAAATRVVSREATPELSPTAANYGTPGTDTSSAVGTPVNIVHHRETPSRDRAETPLDTPPLTHRAAQESLKPKRLVNLLPKQQLYNLGLQTPPSTGLRQKKTTMRPVLGDRTNIPLHLQFPPTPDSINSVLAEGDKFKIPSKFGSVTPSPVVKPIITRRDPRGILGRFDPAKISPDLPFRSGGGDGWDTPAIERNGYFESTFGSPTVATTTTKARPAVPDFTASPEVSFSGSVSTTSSSRRRGSDASMDSDIPTEEWELEAYLKELDRVDRERASAGQVGVGR